MLYTTPKRTLRLALSDFNQKLLEFIDERKYKVSSADVAYRRIHLMGKQGILNDAQQAEGKWRKFSLCELIFLAVSDKLRTYGINSLQLLALHNAFFEKEGEKSTFHSAGSRAIALVFSNIQVILTFSPSDVAFYDDINFAALGVHKTDFIFLNLNNVINELLAKLGHDQQFDYRTALALFSENLPLRTKLDPKEKKVIEVIRGGKYESLRIKLRDNTVCLIKGAKLVEGTLSLRAFAKIVAEGSYGEITAVKQDGTIVGYKVLDSIKP